MMTADFNYYGQEFSCGNPLGLTCDEFDRAAVAAAAYLKQVTSNRVVQEEETDDIKNALCAAAEVFALAQRAKTAAALRQGDVVSEKAGEISVGYSFTRLQEQSGASVPLNKQLYDAVRLYLGDMGLLYRGC